MVGGIFFPYTRAGYLGCHQMVSKHTKVIQGWWNFQLGITEPLWHVKPAAAPPGHVPVAVVGLGRGHRGHPPGPTGTSHTGT